MATILPFTSLRRANDIARFERFCRSVDAWLSPSGIRASARPRDFISRACDVAMPYLYVAHVPLLVRPPPPSACEPVFAVSFGAVSVVDGLTIEWYRTFGVTCANMDAPLLRPKRFTHARRGLPLLDCTPGDVATWVQAVLVPYVDAWMKGLQRVDAEITAAVRRSFDEGAQR